MVPQTVVQEKIVKVPQTIVQEKVIKEKPTNIHHIELNKEMAAPTQFLEAAPAEAGWPWWWWLPLLLLCCCLPLCCLALYWLCCRKKPRAQPRPQPKPIHREPEIKVKPKPREETELQQRKKYTYTKHKIDQEKEIEDEIQRELQASRVRRTDVAREKKERPVVYHHTRYIEKPRIVEEQDIGVYDRTATYDAINRGTRKYQHLDDSYYVQQRPERVERVVETVYEPPVIETAERRLPRSASRKSFVNPNYLAEDVAYQTSRRSGEGYVSREAPRTTVREVVTHQSVDRSPRVASSGRVGNRGQYRYTSGDVMRDDGRDVVYTSGQVVREGDRQGRKSLRGEEQVTLGTQIVDGARRQGNIEEVKYVERAEGGDNSPRSYSSNQRLQEARMRSGRGTSGGNAAAMRVERTEGQSRAIKRGDNSNRNRNYISDSEDDY